MALIQLVYVSVADPHLGDADLDHILAAATHHNALCEVTGMLMYADGQFMQLLEGEEAAVEATFERVRQDPRHHDLMVLERSPITRRDFADWHMGFRRVEDADLRFRPKAALGAGPALAGVVLAARPDADE